MIYFSNIYNFLLIRHFHLLVFYYYIVILEKIALYINKYKIEKKKHYII